MYHPSIIQSSIEKWEAKNKIKLHRYPIGEIDERLASMPKADAKGRVQRQLKPAEKAFVLNEQTLTTFDFLYWAERYGYFISDPESKTGVGLQRFSPWESQKISLRLRAKIQSEQWDRKARGETVEGIRLVDHKGGRQLGLTQLDCFEFVHRMTRLSFQRCVAASVDDDKVLELYDRHQTIYDNLPWFLKPAKRPGNNRGKDWQLKDPAGVALYQNATQKGGLAQGRSRDVTQFTEMASWDAVAGWDITRVQFELQYLPTIPRSVWTLALIESTSLVRGDWWHDFVDRVRLHRMPGWKLNFIPYYSEGSRYTRTAPVGWKPTDESVKHAKMVWETSEEFMGERVMLSKDQLYWYETQYNAAREGRALNLFLVNYAATPDQSFQHASQGAFDSEMLAHMRKATVAPSLYQPVIERAS